MKEFKFLHSFFLFLILNFFSTNCQSQNNTSKSFCGKIPIQTPFLSSNSTNSSSPLNHMVLCRSQKLYLRTSIGLFQVSSINYTTKTLTISHPSSSSNDDSHINGHELGTRISFGIPDHVPDICKECEKSNGNCGVGMRCICHPRECKDKVIAMAGSVKQYGNCVLFSALSAIVVLVSITNSQHLI